MDPKDIYTESIKHFLSPVAPLLDDPDVSEIMINGYDKVYFEKKGRLALSPCRFPSAKLLFAAVTNIAEFCNRRIGGENHSMDARLPDGSRVHVIVPPSSRNGVCVSIRKFKKSTFNLETLCALNSLSSEIAEFLQLTVMLHKNMVISGGTGTGKTSMLNALSTAIPEAERIVVIEDSSELQLKQEHTIYLEAQPAQPDGKGQVTIRDLFVDSLRMRPDRIVVGEVRRGEALDLLQSMISGHAGSLTTVHANTPRDAAIRLETLSLMSDVSLPVYVARMQVASALDIVIQIARFRDGSRKVTHISQLLGLDKDNQYQFADIYRYVPGGLDSDGNVLGKHVRTGSIPTFADEARSAGFGHLVKETEGVFQAS